MLALGWVAVSEQLKNVGWVWAGIKKVANNNNKIRFFETVNNTLFCEVTFLKIRGYFIKEFEGGLMFDNYIDSF